MMAIAITLWCLGLVVALVISSAVTGRRGESRGVPRCPACRRKTHWRVGPLGYSPAICLRCGGLPWR